VYTHVQRWPRAIPQYVLGYQRFKDAIDKVEASAPGLYIGGNCRDGISLSNCIESGRRLATCVMETASAAPRQVPVSFRPPALHPSSLRVTLTDRAEP
jgi:protoporphyrinogen oxidase